MASEKERLERERSDLEKEHTRVKRQLTEKEKELESKFKECEKLRLQLSQAQSSVAQGGFRMDLGAKRAVTLGALSSEVGAKLKQWQERELKVLQEHIKELERQLASCKSSSPVAAPRAPSRSSPVESDAKSRAQTIFALDDRAWSIVSVLSDDLQDAEGDAKELMYGFLNTHGTWFGHVLEDRLKTRRDWVSGGGMGKTYGRLFEDTMFMLYETSEKSLSRKEQIKGFVSLDAGAGQINYLVWDRESPNVKPLQALMSYALWHMKTLSIVGCACEAVQNWCACTCNCNCRKKYCTIQVDLKDGLLWQILSQSYGAFLELQKNEIGSPRSYSEQFADAGRTYGKVDQRTIRAKEAAYRDGALPSPGGARMFRIPLCPF